MRRILSLSVIAALAAAVLFFGCQRQPLNVGVILPLSGDAAKYGEEAKRGIDLAVTEAKDVSVKTIFEDDQNTPAAAVSAFNKLVATSKVPIIIGPMTSSPAMAVAPEAEKDRVVILSPAASNPALTSAGDYFFRNWPSDVYEASAMAKYAAGNMGMKRVAVIGVTADYGTGLARVFSDAFRAAGGEIVVTESYDQGAKDFRAQLAKVKAVNPDGVYLPGYYAEIGPLLRQAKEVGLKSQFISCVGFDNPKVLELAGNAAEGVVFARPYYDPSSQDPKIKAFVERFKTEYGIDPGVYAAHAYDAANIVLQIIRGGATTAAAIKDALYKTKDFPGVTGSTTFDTNGDVVKPIQFIRVSGGRFTATK